MLVADLLSFLEQLAPSRLAQEWDNSGLQVGDPSSRVGRVLGALELSEDVLGEAISGGFDTVITHHPLLFSGFRSLVETRPKERVLRELVKNDIAVISCHTNLDAAEGGIADIAADALGLQKRRPLEAAAANWMKLVGFIPQGAVERVSDAVFSAGAGGVGKYSGCAFSAEGTGWFTPEAGSSPTVGSVGTPEKTEEVRWETVFPKARVGAVVHSFVGAHPYEEPAFDLYPVEDVWPSVGLGRVGEVADSTTLEQLAQTVAATFEVRGVRCSRCEGRAVRVVGVLPGSGRGSVTAAVGQCDVLISGDFTYHDGEVAEEAGLGLIDIPHGGFEWWAYRRWCASLAESLDAEGVEVSLSGKWRDPWCWVEA